jgi:hypothetical protein
VGFLDPKRQTDEDDALPGASGLHLDLDLKRCPACRREVAPWQERCPDCGEVAVGASEVPGSGFALPSALTEGLDDEVPDDGGTDDDPVDDPDDPDDGPHAA